MGKITGFLEYEREDRDYEPVAERVRHWREFVLPLPEAGLRHPGRALHELRRALLPGHRLGRARLAGLSGQQPDPGLERPRLSAATGTRPRATCIRPIIFPKSPAAFVRRRAKPRARSTSTRTRSPSNRSNARSPTAPSRRGSSPSRPRRAPARKSRSSARGRPASPARNNSRAPATRFTSTRRWAKAGGLLRYGIPDFKMEKHHVDRRVAQMQAEGVVFHYGAHVGVNVPADKLLKDYDAVVLTGGAEKPRDLPVPGRELKGIHFAMDFLPQQNRRVSGETGRRRRTDPRQGQARRRHRRRRYRIGLHRHVVPPGRAVGHQFRNHAAAAAAREQDADLAELAAEAAHLVEPRRRRRSAISPC